MADQPDRELINAVNNVGHLGPIIRDLIEAVNKLRTALDEHTAAIQNQK